MQHARASASTKKGPGARSVTRKGAEGKGFGLVDGVAVLICLLQCYFRLLLCSCCIHRTPLRCLPLLDLLHFRAPCSLHWTSSNPQPAAAVAGTSHTPFCWLF
jgi:hypothetical protein